MKNRYSIPSLFVTLLVINACAVNAGRPNFANMSDAELAAYNAALPYDERVVCRDDPQIGSLLRRKICLTYKEDYQAKRNDMNILRTVNSGPVDVDLR